MVSQFYPPVVGGAEHHVRNLSRALVARGHCVSVATIQLDDGLPSYTRDEYGVTVHRLRTSIQRMDRVFTTERKNAPPIADPEGTLALRRIIRAEKPDVVHAHDWLGRSLLPRVARERRPLLVTLHDYSRVCAQKRLVYRHAPCAGPGPRKCLECATDFYGRVKGPSIALGNWIARSSDLRFVNLYLPVSRAVAHGNQLERRGLPFRVIPNFVPDDIGMMPDGDDVALAKLPDGDFLLFVGDVARDKGVEVLLDAYRRLDSPPPLVLIGRIYLPLDNLPRGVLALGMLPTAAVMAAWRRSLLGVAPSIVPDSCPTVVMEAMAVGRPVIGTWNGGISDLIDDGQTGILVPHSDAAALAHALQRVLDSPELRQRMSLAAGRKFEQFSASSVVPQIEQAYGETLRG